MKKSQSTFLVSCFSSLLMISSSLVADTDPSKPNESNTQINSRPLSSETLSMMQKNRACETTEEETSKEENSNVTQIGPHKPKTNIVNVVAPFSSHWITSFSLNGDVIELEDGSQWSVALNEVFKVLGWQVGNNISITPNYAPFSAYTYFIVNNTTGNYVHVSPIIGPIANGPNTNWIVGIDYINGQISIINGNGNSSIWYINSADYYLFSNWAINDTIIVGDNTSWLYAFSAYRNILINVNMNHFVRARQL